LKRHDERLEVEVGPYLSLPPIRSMVSSLAIEVGMVAQHWVSLMTGDYTKLPQVRRPVFSALQNIRGTVPRPHEFVDLVKPLTHGKTTIRTQSRQLVPANGVGRSGVRELLTWIIQIAYFPIFENLLPKFMAVPMTA